MAKEGQLKSPKNANLKRGTGAGLGGPTADNSMRQSGDGNVPATGEVHGKAKSRTISSDVNRTTGPIARAVNQPTRQNGDGNTSVTGEMHSQKKARIIPESQRW